MRGFVLAGGQSSRMGRDKALLPWRGATLLEYVASQVRAAAGNVTVIAQEKRYAHLGLPLQPDIIPSSGPLSGIHSALSITTGWALVAACDMPQINAEFLRLIIDAAVEAEADALLPAGPSGQPEPLCACYHRRCLPVIEAALNAGVRKVTDAFAGLRVAEMACETDRYFRNWNTPGDVG